MFHVQPRIGHWVQHVHVEGEFGWVSEGGGGGICFILVVKSAQVGLAKYPEGGSTANLVLQRLPLVCTLLYSRTKIEIQTLKQ